MCVLFKIKFNSQARSCNQTKCPILARVDRRERSKPSRPLLLTKFEFESISSGAAPSWINRLSRPATSVVVTVLPAGWIGEWHENPKPQLIVLSGGWFVETMDGKRMEMSPGELSFGNDQNTKTDAEGRRGHRSGAVGNQPAVIMLVQADQDPTNSKACQISRNNQF